MKPINLILLTISISFFCANVAAQLKITDGNTAPYNPNNLVRNVFLGSGVEVTNVQFSGDPKAVGFFSGGLSNINLDRGIIMSTSQVRVVDSENSSTQDTDGNTDNTNGGTNDVDLENIATGGLDDIAKYTISFIPAADTLRFRYVFASEEYPEFICQEFNDVFGFFISGPDPEGGSYNSENIALVPDPADPTGLTFTNIPVAINNVHDGNNGICPPSYSDYYNINPLGTKNFQHNAYTSLFTAEAIVVPCEEYTIKLVIGDVVDNLYGSSVFLEAKSFGTGTLAVELNSLSVDGSLAEGCGAGELEFFLPEAVDRDYNIDIEFFTPANAATPGIDYPAIPDQLVIPAGSRSVTVPLEAFQDGESEMDEVISFEIQVDVCNRKKFEIIIRDDDLFAPILPLDTTICSGDSYLIESALDPSFIIPDDPFFFNPDTIDILPEMEPIYSDIIVAGVIPTTLQPNIIERVCITGLEHRDLTDFDIYLISPGEQILELSTDNGFKPNNFADVDRYENTCFTQFATTSIDNGNNLVGDIFADNPTYTGDFLPEGVWSDLWDGENPTNGTWRLLVLDDMTGATGRLEGWSITFRSFYGLTYEWSSNPSSALCENCEDINVTPQVETEYTLKVIDSYGCERSASTRVTVDPSLDTPIPDCGQITENSIEVLWNNIDQNQGYEIRIDGGGWIPVSSENYTFLSLASSNDFSIEVRAVGPNCSSQPGQLICRTADCAQPTISLAIDQEVSCSGGNDGEVTITATGVGPFIYEIGAFSNSTGIFTNVPVGPNVYAVTDATGCKASDDFLMPGPADFMIQSGYQISDPCNVVSDLTGSVLVTGGTAPYTYLWSSGSTGKDAGNLVPGNYTVTITDLNGCDTVAELNIPDLEQFIWEVTTTPPLCKNENSGIAAVNVLSGTPPYTYLWEDGSSESDNKNLGEGNYVVTVTDALGCEETKFFTISSGPTISIEITPNETSCLGQDDGTAFAEVSGGLAPYTFSWESGNAAGESVSGLMAGTYTLSVTDANNCTAMSEFTIVEPNGMTFETAKIDNLCFGFSEGEIVVENVESPNGMVTISWQDGATGFSRAGLMNGTYCFTLNDGTVCELEECIDISSPNEIIINEMVNGPRCEGSMDGTINVQVDGGSGTFTYEWEGPTANLTPTDEILNLNAGLYSVTVTDESTCTAMKDIMVDPPNPIRIDSSVFSISCNGAEAGRIFFAASGGSPPFAYEWSGPNGFSATTNNIENVIAGNYTVRYTDNAGCSESFNFTITQPELPLLVNISDTDSICFGFENGKLSVNPTGGTAPYTVLWSNSDDNFENLALSPGSYTVTVTDSRNCEVISEGRVVETSEIQLTLDQSPSSCFQTQDGRAVITDISYGSVSEEISNFDIVWNTTPAQTEVEAERLTGGLEYTVVVTDAKGCKGEETIMIETPDPVASEIVNLANVSCFNGTDGSLEIQGIGGSGSYSYLWDNNAGSTASAVVNMLSRGNYMVTITDDNGCEGSNTYSVGEPRPLDLGFRSRDVSCFSGTDGRAEAVVNGGTIPYTYEWSNDSRDGAIENIVSDWYYLTVTDDNNCEISDSILIFQPDDPIIASFETEDVSCFEGRNGRIEVEASGGSGFYRYSIDGASFSSTSVFPNLTAGTYTIYVNDFKGCIDTFTDVFIFEPGELIVDLGEDIVIPFGNSVELSPSIFNASGSLSFDWNSANLDLLSCTNCQNPTFEGEREASYELIVVDEKGCRGNDFVTIRLENFSPLFVPTAFTPNDDDENDVLALFGRGIKIINRFSIYDRWGELVYTLEDQEIDGKFESWDGNFRSEKAPGGLYYWFAEVEFENGFIESFKGNTTLLR